MHKKATSIVLLVLVVLLLTQESHGQYKNGMYSRLQNHQNKRALPKVPRVKPAPESLEGSDSAAQDIYQPPVYQQPQFVEGGVRPPRGNVYQDPYQYNPQPPLYHGNGFGRDAYQPMNQYNPYLSNQPLSNQPLYYNNPYNNPVKSFNQPYFKGNQVGGGFGAPYQQNDRQPESRPGEEAEDAKEEDVVPDPQENFNQENFNQEGFGRDQYGQGFGMNVNQMQNYGPSPDGYGGPISNYRDGGYNINYKHQGVSMNQVQPDAFKPFNYGNDQFRNLPSNDYQQGPVFNENSFAVPGLFALINSAVARTKNCFTYNL